MKKLIIKLTLIVIMVVACNTAMALTDGPGVQALMHCDATNQGYWLTTPDDNSSGRAVNECILDMAIDFASINTATEPTLMPNSPISGSYFSFDGTDDSICFNPGWLGGDSLLFECSFKANSFAPSGQYDVLGGCNDTWVCFLSNQNGTPHISLMLSMSIMIDSPVEIIAGEWNDIRVTVDNDDVSITVNGSTYTEHSTVAFPTQASLLAVGYNLRGGDRYLDGDMDEVRIGNIPEPFTFGLIGIFGLLALRLRK